MIKSLAMLNARLPKTSLPRQKHLALLGAAVQLTSLLRISQLSTPAQLISIHFFLRILQFRLCILPSQISQGRPLGWPPRNDRIDAQVVPPESHQLRHRRGSARSWLSGGAVCAGQVERGQATHERREDCKGEVCPRHFLHFSLMTPNCL